VDLLAVLSERLVRLPLGRGARSRLLQHLVDLLQGQALGLGDEEEREQEAERASAAPDKEHLGLEVALIRVDLFL
jgi:hypothetical protein